MTEHAATQWSMDAFKFAAEKICDALFTRLQITHAEKLHQESYARDIKMHHEQLNRSMELHYKETALSIDMYKRDVQLAKQQQLMGMTCDIELTLAQMQSDLTAAMKESERDQYDQRNQQLQTTIIAASLMMASLYTILIQGVLPTDHDYSPSLTIAFAATLGASLCLLFVSIVLCIETLRLASTYMIKRSRIDLDTYEVRKDRMKSTLASLYDKDWKSDDVAGKAFSFADDTYNSSLRLMKYAKVASEKARMPPSSSSPERLSPGKALESVQIGNSDLGVAGLAVGLALFADTHTEVSISSIVTLGAAATVGGVLRSNAGLGLIGPGSSHCGDQIPAECVQYDSEEEFDLYVKPAEPEAMEEREEREGREKEDASAPADGCMAAPAPGDAGDLAGGEEDPAYKITEMIWQNVERRCRHIASDFVNGLDGKVLRTKDRQEDKQVEYESFGRMLRCARRRMLSNNAAPELLTFEDFWETECWFYQEWATRTFYLGTLFLLAATGIWCWLQFSQVYMGDGNYTAASVIISLIGAGCAGGFILWLAILPSGRVGMFRASEGAARSAPQCLGAGPCCPETAVYPLHVVCKKISEEGGQEADSQLAAIKALLSAYPDWAAERDAEGKLPLQYVCGMPDPSVDVVRELLAVYPGAAEAVREVTGKANEVLQAAKKNASGKLPLHTACEDSEFELAQALFTLFPGAVRIKDRQGNLPLHCACSVRAEKKISFPKKWPALVKVLLMAHVGAADEANNAGDLPLHLACASRAGKEVVQDLLARHPEAVRRRNKMKYLPMHLACQGQEVLIEVIQLLAEGPGAVSRTTQLERTVSHLDFRSSSTSSGQTASNAPGTPNASLQSKKTPSGPPAGLSTFHRAKSADAAGTSSILSPELRSSSMGSQAAGGTVGSRKPPRSASQAKQEQEQSETDQKLGVTSVHS